VLQTVRRPGASILGARVPLLALTAHDCVCVACVLHACMCVACVCVYVVCIHTGNREHLTKETFQKPVRTDEQLVKRNKRPRSTKAENATHPNPSVQLKRACL